MGFLEAVRADLLKWTYNPSQARGFGGRFGNGTGTAQQPKPPKVKPVNPAAMPRAVTNPAMPPAPVAVAAPAAGPVGRSTVPSPPRAPQGKPAAGGDAPAGSSRQGVTHTGDQTLTVSASDRERHTQRQEHSDVIASQHAAARQRRADAAAALKAERAAAAARIAKASKALPMPKGARAAAVAAARKRYGIPKGKAFTHLSSARKKAAQQILQAAGNLVSLNHDEANAQRRIDAITKELNRKGASDALKKSLTARLKTANASMAAWKTKYKAAQNSLAAGRKAYHHH